jgi:hypothetical protein
MAARISLAGPQSDVQGRMATATTGTGTLTLGSASPNATTFSGMPVPIADGDTLTYELVDLGVSPPGKEKGRGTYHSAGPTLSRDAIIWSTNANARLNLSGNAFVFVTADDSDVVLASQARTLLTAATTFYIATNGSDSNDGKTPATAWLTFVHAAAVLSGQIDFGGQTVTLQAVAGHATFTSQLLVSAWVGGGALVFDGGGGSIATTNGSPIRIALGTVLPGPFTYQNVSLSHGGAGTEATPGNISHSGIGGVFQGAGVTHKTAISSHITVKGGATLTITAPYTVDFTGGGAGQHFNLGVGLIVGDQFPATVTFTGSPFFSDAFADVSVGQAFLEGLTLPSGGSFKSGNVALNGILFRNGRGLPGNGTVTTSNGGQYI